MITRLAPAAVLAALLIAGCSAGTPGTPSAATPAPDGPGTCRIEAGSGSVSMRGGSGRVSTTNGVSTFTCGTGPALTLARVSADGVDLQAGGGGPVTTVRTGATASVGPYTITVDAVTGGKATLRVAPPG